MIKNAITGYQIPLLQELSRDLKDAKKIKLIVSFILESGAKLLVPILEELCQKGVSVNVLTGTYLNVTEPSAIYLLKYRLGNYVDIRFYADSSVSFHPKGYLIEKDDDSIGYIGSSNLSYSALVSGVEWNYRFLKSRSPDEYAGFNEMFNNLFLHHSFKGTDEFLKQYASNWKKTIFNEENSSKCVSEKIEPRGAQVEALYCLEEARKEGLTKGLVVAATGIGKTYLAAFDSRKFRRILFVAHREEILQQAAESFSLVRPKDSIGFFYGNSKDEAVDILFATVQTIGKEQYLNPEFFQPESFDYIIIDEFHHAAANSYQKIFQYFCPRFFLGLTATPFRMDNRDILGLCDDNVIYEIYLRDAINRGYLVPFNYYAFFDETDYEAIPYQNGHYQLDKLERALSSGGRLDLILSKYKQYAGKKVLGFCAGIKHAEYMAEHFNLNHIPAAVIHSGKSESQYYMEREQAIQALKLEKIRVIFSVDLFNEGVDIPEIDTVLFLRPTESIVVFLQQLGRGLRKYYNKTQLTVLDFIGNYKRAHYVPFLLAGHNPLAIQERKGCFSEELDYPDGCHVNFDFRLIDLFTEMRRNDPLKKRMQDEYWRLARELNRRPTRLDIFIGSDIPLKHYLRDDGWVGFLNSLGELDNEEKGWFDTIVPNFLRELERTSMTKSYKIPTLMSFLDDNNNWVPKVDKARLASVWRRYYSNMAYQQDMQRDSSSRSWTSWDDDRLAKLAIERFSYLTI